MIGAPNSLNLNCKLRAMKEAPGPLVSEEIADIFTNYNRYIYISEKTALMLKQSLDGYTDIPVCRQSELFSP